MDIVNLPDGKILVRETSDINLPLTLDCGQAFRWENRADGISAGTAYGKSVEVYSSPEGLVFSKTDRETVEKIWYDYFDCGRDYKGIIKNLCNDPLIEKAAGHYGTVRILNQEPFETLCSFIISACNNIPRIKGIIKKLCEKWGEDTGGGFTFPAPEILAVKEPDELTFLHAGYRVPYILDAAKKTAEGEIDFDKIREMPEAEARRELMKVKGVGRKVADCTLLFSLGFTDIWPVDVHIKRAQEKYYPGGLPEFFHPYSGLAQQYVFHYQRMGDSFAGKEK